MRERPVCPSVKLIWNSFVLGRPGGNLNALDCFRLHDSGCRPLSVQGTLLRRRQSRFSHWLNAEIWLISVHLLGHLYPTTPALSARDGNPLTTSPGRSPLSVDGPFISN
jgi:hypothetical protein